MKGKHLVISITFALLSAAIVTSTSCGTGRKAALPGDLFGIHLQPQLESSYEEAFTQMQDLGVRWVRGAARWFLLEPAQGNYDFSSLDPIVASAQKHGLKMMLTIKALSPWGSTKIPPEWDKPGYHPSSLPKDLAQYGAFVEALATRYKGQGIAWQIDNEPNAKAFWDGTKEEYLAMLRAGYDGAHRGDPQAVVLPAGLACGFSRIGFNEVKMNNIRSWFDAILDSKAYDALDVHDYYPPAEGNPWGLTFEQYLRDFREWMDAKGVNVPLWMSEVGVSSEPIKSGGQTLESTPPRQAEDLREIYEIAARRGIAHVFWLKMVDTPETVFSYMGLSAQDGTHKAAWEAYREADGANGRYGGVPVAH